MEDTLPTDHRRAFSTWLRTGRVPTIRRGGVELKFNPYHDPDNGRFTFAPGGPRSLSRVVTVHRRPSYTPPSDAPSPPHDRGAAPPTTGVPQTATPGTAPPVAPPDAASRAADRSAAVRLAQIRRPTRPSRGSNSRAFEDPMLLEQAFPGLRDAPAGAMVAVADNLFDLTGPAREATAALALAQSKALIADIKAIDPKWEYHSLGFPTTMEGQINEINDLRFTRAVTLLRAHNDPKALQVETLRFMQCRVDRAYADGLKRLKSGRLPIRLSEREALGNYIDREVRQDLKNLYGAAYIDSTGPGPVRVNRRERNSSEGTYKRPDTRVANVAYDITLTQKTLKLLKFVAFLPPTPSRITWSSFGRASLAPATPMPSSDREKADDEKLPGDR